MPENLTKAVQDLRTEVDKLRREFRRRTVVVALLSVALILTVVAGLVLQASNESRIAANNRRWCPMVTLLIPGPGDAPPGTPRGREIAARAEILADEFRCPPRTN